MAWRHSVHSSSLSLLGFARLLTAFEDWSLEVKLDGSDAMVPSSLHNSSTADGLFADPRRYRSTVSGNMQALVHQDLADKVFLLACSQLSRNA